MSQIDWSKAPEGAEFYSPSVKLFYRHLDGEFQKFLESRGRWTVAAGERYEYTSLIAKPTEWTGEGLPPVGTACEAWVARDEWRECVVVALDDDDGTPVSVVRLGNSYFGMTLKTLRPIRTPEQIAAEERDDGIAAIQKASGGDSLPPITYTHAAKLYNAGVRMPVEGKKP